MRQAVCILTPGLHMCMSGGQGFPQAIISPLSGRTHHPSLAAPHYANI